MNNSVGLQSQSSIIDTKMEQLSYINNLYSVYDNYLILFSSKRYANIAHKYYRL
jgi:Rad3-related DNA helicase